MHHIATIAIKQANPFLFRAPQRQHFTITAKDWCRNPHQGSILIILHALHFELRSNFGMRHGKAFCLRVKGDNVTCLVIETDHFEFSRRRGRARHEQERESGERNERPLLCHSLTREAKDECQMNDEASLHSDSFAMIFSTKRAMDPEWRRR